MPKLKKPSQVRRNAWLTYPLQLMVCLKPLQRRTSRNFVKTLTLAMVAGAMEMHIEAFQQDPDGKDSKLVVRGYKTQ